MRDLIIRNLDENLIVELKRRAWHQGVPLEVSLRRLLMASIEDESEPGERAFFLTQATPGGARLRGTAPYELHN
jgi:plasmid stability protein